MSVVLSFQTASFEALRDVELRTTAIQVVWRILNGRRVHDVTRIRVLVRRASSRETFEWAGRSYQHTRKRESTGL